jgi:Ulp1 family protease
MGKYLALVLVIPLLFSCAARKVAVSKTQTQTYTDSVAVEKKDSVSVQQNAIVVIDSTEEIELTPIDTAKPIIIGETKYFNAKVKVRKIRKRITDSSTIMVAKLTEKQVGVKKEVKQKTFDKKVDKKANYLLYLWLLLIPVVVWLIWRFGRK